MSGHPNLSDEINRNIAQSEADGGMSLKSLAVGKTLMIQTKNTLYRIEKRGESEFYISGNQRFCPESTKANIHGSTWGGSMLKMGFVGIGMRLEFSVEGHRAITTSIISSIQVQ